MPSSLHTIPVHTAPPYQVAVGSGLLAACGPRLREVLSPCRIAVITDSHVAPLYLERVCTSLQSAGFSVVSRVVPAGEQHKTLATLAQLLEFLAEEHLTRTDCVAALGGGVIGDMAGFAAAVYLRGIPCVQLPTTLLSAVDSSVGGKTAVDLTAGKNLAGAFFQPAAVLCDHLFSLFESGSLDLPEIITRCVSYKAGVVERDPTEQGERKLLNLGHTVGHAIEACSGFSIPHGHAVAAGLAVMARAAQTLSWTSGPLAERITACLAKNGLPTSTDYSAEALAQAALSDKKRTGDSITVVIPRQIGVCELRKLPVSQLQSLIAAGLEV